MREGVGVWIMPLNRGLCRKSGLLHCSILVVALDRACCIAYECYSAMRSNVETTVGKLFDLQYK